MTRTGPIESRKARWLLAGLSTAMLFCVRRADAYLLIGKSDKTTNPHTQVVLVREGEETILSIEPSVRGVAGEVALIIPVPASASSGTTLRSGSLAPVERVIGPRLAEFWEQDPCEYHDLPVASDGLFDASLAPPLPTPADYGDAAYRTETSAASTGADFARALKAEEYRVPDKLESIAEGYLRAGMKLVVARFDASKLSREGETVALPALRLRYRAEDLTLPTRLFAAGGSRELGVVVISRGNRFEAKGENNLAVPTNLDAADPLRTSLLPFYRALLDRSFEKNPGAVLTEYAWRASNCELCSGPVSTRELAGLGTSLLPSATEGRQLEVLVDANNVSVRPDGPEEVKGRLGACYAKALASTQDLSGVVTLALEVDGQGSVTVAKPMGTPDATLLACASEGVNGSKGWKPDAKGPVTVTFSPISRAFYADLVFTALRARYERVPEHDLTLTPGRAIEGGREFGPEGTVEKRVYPAPAGNDFQARYVVRHPFEGAIACGAPVRGMWGPNPVAQAVRKPPEALPAQDGGIRLESWIQGGLPDFSAFAIHFGPPPPEPPAPSVLPPPASAPAPPPSAAPTAPVARGGCGDCCTGGSADPSGWPLLLPLAAWALRRRAGGC